MVLISILLLLLLLFYLAFLLIGIDFNLFLVKLKSMLLTKSLHFLFSRLGWCGGGLVIAVVFSLLDPELAKMMAPSGASGASSSEATSVDKGPTRNEASSSGSESWKQYLNLSSDNEGNGSAAPSTDRTPRHQPTSDQTVDQPVQTQPPAAGPSEPRRDPSHAPEPSTSSTWSGSWIQRWLYPEVSSSAPNEGGQPQGEEATSQPTGVIEQREPVPTKEEVENELFTFLSSFGNREVRKDVFSKTISALDLNGASPEKLFKIRLLMQELYNRPVAAFQARDALLKALKEWEKRDGGV
uniref:hypothetical protein n=1 Tax=Jatropha curcas TaxID=180498 RepID=UPI00279D5426|nr:hypothetical protein QLP06_mgp043 [Jatropha curcas]WFG81196.1 hypothetical protein [Jatropha curcas]